jgi:hypothetical protein
MIGSTARPMKYALCAAGSNLATARNRHRSPPWSLFFIQSELADEQAAYRTDAGKPVVIHIDQQ